MPPKHQAESLAILLHQTRLPKSSLSQFQLRHDFLLMGSSTANISPIISQPLQKVCSFTLSCINLTFAVSESVFSGRTGRSSKTESTRSSVESTSSGRFVQPLSPASFVTRSTELTISPSNSVKAVEQLATVVRISSAGTIPIQIHESPTKL